MSLISGYTNMRRTMRNRLRYAKVRQAESAGVAEDRASRKAWAERCRAHSRAAERAKAS